MSWRNFFYVYSHQFAEIRYQVEEISDPRRPSEIAKRYEDLFNYSYDMFECLEEVLGAERKCSKFTNIMLTVRDH